MKDIKHKVWDTKTELLIFLTSQRFSPAQQYNSGKFMQIQILRERWKIIAATATPPKPISADTQTHAEAWENPTGNIFLEAGQGHVSRSSWWYPKTNVVQVLPVRRWQYLCYTFVIVFCVYLIGLWLKDGKYTIRLPAPTFRTCCEHPLCDVISHYFQTCTWSPSYSVHRIQSNPGWRGKGDLFAVSQCFWSSPCACLQSDK